jgi:hypothetical protein
MDLTTTYPRSAKHKMAGIVSLARMTDKARAFNEGKLGEYDFDCPHDKPVLAFLGVPGPAFAAKVAELDDDAAIERWVARDLLAQKTAAELEAFNEARRAWRPDPGSHSAEYFAHLRDEIAPGRSEIVTWFDLLDLDEKRPVTVAHA